MNTVHIFGAGITDEVFDLELPGLTITWNVTKINEAAAAGLFGPPIELPLSYFPPMTEANWENIDRKKVSEIIRAGDKAIDEPVVNLLFMRNDQLHGMIVDGNHRLTARLVLGLESVSSYEVPPELERSYRVTFL